PRHALPPAVCETVPADPHHPDWPPHLLRNPPGRTLQCRARNLRADGPMPPVRRAVSRASSSRSHRPASRTWRVSPSPDPGLQEFAAKDAPDRSVKKANPSTFQYVVNKTVIIV